MKFINKLLIITLVLAFTACDADLNLQDNPNAVTAENASVDDLFSNIQLGVRNFYNSLWGNAAGFSRMDHQGGAYAYENATSPEGFNDEWRHIYSTLLPDMQALIALAEARNLDVHKGAVLVLQAYVLSVAVDMFGDIPYSEALQGTDIISPKRDAGADVYAAADGMLDEAISLMSGTSASGPATDIFYDGNTAKWVTLAKTLKLRNAVTTRLVNTSAAATVNAIVSGGDFIDDASKDFQFNYGNNRTNPNARHPFYNDSYEASDGSYQSNYYMWLLDSEKVDADGRAIEDPRLRFYFYRQTDDSRGHDVTVYGCHWSTFPVVDATPAHYLAVDSRMPYCVASDDGYYGRDHLNNEGTPPDGPIKTVYGVYPAGGQFDDNSFEFTQQQGTTGGLGQGINPIMLSSFVSFLRSEAALTMGTGEDARALLEEGIRTSIDKVFSFKGLVPATMSRQIDDGRGNIFTAEELYVQTDEEIDNYVAYVLDAFDNADADGKLNVVMKEYYLALWGNGIESYNMYRRTGKPDNMQPTLENGAGGFVRSFYYPADHVNLNSNAEQKSVTDPVFWDTNPASLTY